MRGHGLVMWISGQMLVVPLAIKYLENGHVTLPQNQLGKPPGAGTVHVFVTLSPDEKRDTYRCSAVDCRWHGKGLQKHHTMDHLAWKSGHGGKIEVLVEDQVRREWQQPRMH
jgi:hypothetical protein